MKKRVLAIFLTLLMAFSSLTATAFAADIFKNWLYDSHKNIYAGQSFEGLDTFVLYNPLKLNADVSDANADFSYWHFVDTSKESQYAEISFMTENGAVEIWRVEPCFNNQHFAVITPSGWKLSDGVSYSTASGNFVLSHSGRHKASLGKVRATASVHPYYYEITPYEYYERSVDEYYEHTVDEYYKRTVDEYYERTVDEYYERTVEEYYERPVQEYYERYAQRYLVPVFQRKMGGVYDTTLVTRLNYNGNTVNAKPINGGAFKNGHTYVAVNVADASKDGGVWYTIGDSSKNNGKKTPDQYNKPIDYQYNVQIKYGKLTVSCGDDLAYASVGAFVYASAPNDAKNAPSHYPDSVTVNMPKNYGNIVYLYTHFDKLGWYDTDSDGNYIYEFVEWRHHHTQYGDYELVKTEKGEYALADTKYGDYELVKTEKGAYILVDTKYGDYELEKTIKGEYALVDTKYGSYELVSRHEDKNKVDAAYTGTLTLTVNGEVKPLDEDFYLTPGVYTFTVTGSGTEFEPISKTVTIVPGDNGTVDFGKISYALDDVMLETIKTYADREATLHYADKKATLHYADEEATLHYADKEATLHYADKEATLHYADKKLEPIYQEEYIYKPDIKLGDEMDAFGEYAIRLN